jgi:acetyltransferase-like isoleucine patch superfamily enzyme
MKFCVHPSELAPGLMLGHDVELGDEVELGANVVIHSGTVVGAGCEIQDGVVLGKQPRLGPRSTASTGELEPLVIEPKATVCAGAVLYAGARIGEGAIVGDQAQVRERSSVGASTVVGRGTAIDNDVFVGANVRVQSNCYLTAHSRIEDEVFVAPGVVTTNDDTMGRHGDDHRLEGAVFARRCRVGGGAVITPGTVIGEEAFVAAGAVVVEDVPARAVVMGVPAKRVRDVPEGDLWERWT